jgi:AcrR family transcriptional regulator
MPRDSTVTREKLIRAAEYLFARHGFDVPIRDIQDRAGQRNATALQYHFGGKRELVWAIIEKNSMTPEQTQAVRDDLASKQGDARALVEAIVRRLTAPLATEEGRDYMRLAFQLVTQAPVRQSMVDGVETPQLVSVPYESALIRMVVPSLPERLVQERAVAGLTFVLLQVADRARVIDDNESKGLIDEEDFIANLVDMTTALLTAPTTVAAGAGLSGTQRQSA